MYATLFARHSPAISTMTTKQDSNTTPERTSLLRTRAHVFCHSLISPPAPRELLSEYFISDSQHSKPTILEHGPSWATPRLPFLAHEFIGVDACEEYFNLLSKTLKMKIRNGSFPEEGGFVVDTEQNQVSVVGKGRFESLETGRSWDEQFVYVLSGWDHEGKLGRWDIWADPLSAWAAVGKDDVDGWKRGEHRS